MSDSLSELRAVITERMNLLWQRFCSHMIAAPQSGSFTKHWEIITTTNPVPFLSSRRRPEIRSGDPFRAIHAMTGSDTRRRTSSDNGP
ncbi:unnamed protein product [Lota lota]